MSTVNFETLKYPIGSFIKPDHISEAQIQEWIQTIEDLPETLTSVVKSLSVEQLHWPYRPEGS